MLCVGCVLKCGLKRWYQNSSFLKEMKKVILTVCLRTKRKPQVWKWQLPALYKWPLLVLLSYPSIYSTTRSFPVRIMYLSVTFHCCPMRCAQACRAWLCLQVVEEKAQMSPRCKGKLVQISRIYFCVSQHGSRSVADSPWNIRMHCSRNWCRDSALSWKLASTVPHSSVRRACRIRV